MGSLCLDLSDHGLKFVKSGRLTYTYRRLEKKGAIESRRCDAPGWVVLDRIGLASELQSSELKAGSESLMRVCIKISYSIILATMVPTI